MSTIRVLDCTLRDGGYCNQWRFGKKTIRQIIQRLINSNVDIIECGFITNKNTYDIDCSKYLRFEEVGAMIPTKRSGKLFVCMMNYGEYNAEDIPEYDGKSVDGIRVAFHKKNVNEALEFCKKIKGKGYKVFIQAMVSLSYNDLEFLDLIHKCNELDPYSFYIVDSFGLMKRKDLIRMFYMVENNLKDGIYIGYHAHNNMQLAYSNAQALVDIRTDRDLIIDSSVFGMGRGAGNLNTELFVEYLNDSIGSNYHIKPLLSIADEFLLAFYEKNRWGYSLPNYLSASHWAHPNYAGFLDDKKTLTVENIDEIFSMMDENKKKSFDKAYIEDLYTKYLATGHVQEEHLTELRNLLKQKELLLIAPGKSSDEEKERIIDFAMRPNVISVGLNFNYPHYDTNFIFLSNLRRFRELDESKLSKCIITANIPPVSVYLQTQYFDLLNDVEAVGDNVGMMAIRFFINQGVTKITIAGMDGYSHDTSVNYAANSIANVTKSALVDMINSGMNTLIKRFMTEVDIEFLTKPNFLK